MFIYIVCFQFDCIGLENPIGGVVKLVYIHTCVNHQITQSAITFPFLLGSFVFVRFYLLLNFIGLKKHS